MSGARLARIVQQARAAGVLPADAVVPARDSRPWPLLLMSALGAWLAALPLLLGLGIMLGEVLMRGPGPYLVGAAMLVAAAMAFRSSGLTLFAEQLALPALLVGLGMLAFGLGRDLPEQVAAAVLAVLVCALAWLLPRDWLRVLLGAAACLLLVAACVLGRGFLSLERYPFGFWLAWQAALLCWVGAQRLQRRLGGDGAGARHAALLECVGAGWLLATLAGLAHWSGTSFLVGASFGGAGRVLWGAADGMGWYGALMQAGSAALALAAAATLARAWPGLRQPWLVGVALVLVGLAWLMPALGALWLALALCAANARWLSAAAAACAAAWVVGGFYYQLELPLATKALLLLGAAVALAALVWLAPTSGAAAAAPAAAADLGARRSRLAIGACALAVLLLANGAIWQKEQLIAQGRPVYVDLVPVDPRSLMQGDFMSLRFPLPEGMNWQPQHWSEQRPYVVAHSDARGVAAIKRVHGVEALAAGEFLMQLTPKNGSWVLVTDAWFFKEGEAERWSKARYGEFRVAPDGRALLVGMRGAKLEKL
ncbi:MULTISPECIES: GDYXXLXY domain-containing protein [unclassified Janthinobacterium]|uniref:GDYXXLXY domain-containing protein n=1 Tax=unclassified Janthinobacterium TaxID=2610881 RepID=UPI000347E37A|nr:MULTISPECIES: GDYXXLXY domain-containing protein [unclassified Janthinobacterium]MEC5159723.1 putative membrane-anchored protein [Janthinobacterium sp. CG_S6]